MTSSRPMLSLYLHIPFCVRKCTYCSFYSIESFAGRERFLSAIDAEIERSESNGEEVGTIFFGGGTPSLLSPDEINAIMERIRSRYQILPEAEVTMECNPGSMNREWLEGYRSAGINRLSFGVQSFDNEELNFLSRIHTAEEAEKNIRLVREVFDNVSLDLIFALPDQTREMWMRNLRKGVELGTDHISAYALIFEEGTPLNRMKLRGEIAPASMDLEADMYEDTVPFLAANGLEQYETSNYARPGFACRHNIVYWERKSYRGFGPSAHSFFRNESQYGLRQANVSSLTAYLEAVEGGKSPAISREELSQEQAVEEIVMLGLRYNGIDRQEFSAAAGSDVNDAAGDVVRKMVDQEYAILSERHLQLTPKGTIFADRFALEIIDAAERAGQHASS